MKTSNNIKTSFAQEEIFGFRFLTFSPTANSELICLGNILADFQEAEDWKIEADSKPKRTRTIFTADQLERLEKEFDRQQY